jgi:lipopolysaccharide biosynthesis protein
MVTNSRKIEKIPELLNKDIIIQPVENEGYDFGMFYKAFQEIDPSQYDQIACINDSNILFGELNTFLKWGNEQQVDFWGLVDSNEAPWFSTHKNNYHLQSHFLVFNKKAINSLPAFFNAMDMKSIYAEKDTKKLRRFIVDQWEIGLSQFLLNKGLTSASYFNSLSLFAKYKVKGKNVTHSLYQELIKEGYPLIKKKVALKKSWRSILGWEEPWEKLIKEYAFSGHNIPILIKDIKSVASK